MSADVDSSRRSLLGAVTTLLLAIPIAGPLLLSLFVITSKKPAAKKQKIATLRLADIPQDDVRTFQLSYTRVVGPYREVVHERIFLRRQGQEVIALSSECTHLGCPVEFTKAEKGADAKTASFRCPCHKGAFDLMGKVTYGPPESPLKRFAVDPIADPQQPVTIQV